MITESFRSDPTAVINPEDIVSAIPGFPAVAVTCFSGVTFERLCRELSAEPIREAVSGDANGAIAVYRASWKGCDFALYLSRVGAAGCVGMLEDIFVFGAKAVVVFGTCGVLDGSIRDCGVILPTSAVRDEGTSYHYAPASETIAVNVDTLSAAERVFNDLGVEYVKGKVWTTDGFYRETRTLVDLRKKEDCIAVDMECSALAAVAQFRKKRLLQFFYAADNLDAETWDARSLSNERNLFEKDRIAFLAMELASTLYEPEDCTDDRTGKNACRQAL